MVRLLIFNAIKRYHMQVRGWSDIGYHYVIEKVGDKYEILKGRDEKTPGAHCKEQHCNFESIGICLVGNFDIAEPPQAQLDKLYELLEDIFKRYGKMKIYGHNHFAKYKSCPGTKFPMNKVLAEAFQRKKKHWAEKCFINLNNKGITIHEKRFNDPITRGEVFALLDQLTDRK
ncbi:N-acetylmuramoyl-L-alanine amidase [Crassaminicella thermophila]|uniref:N-acetylmuramoyl-L-alanine amidase n=1 Tax=Crassaminicella thermophila TaxID=2599308 RepID=A0A5C0SFS9_CRATE|nr:N-acetylmuramoyl-L-alanine amidase [Crassaminicella thermophila]